MTRFLVRGFTARIAALILLDTVLIVCAVGIAAYLRLGNWAWDVVLYENGVAKTVLVAAVAQTCLYYLDLYDLHLVSERRELFIRLVQALASTSFVLAAVYFWFPSLIIG